MDSTTAIKEECQVSLRGILKKNQLPDTSPRGVARRFRGC